MGIETKSKRRFKNQLSDKSIYNWIMNHRNFFKSLIFNDSLKVNIDGNIRPKIVIKLLLQVSIRELYKKRFSDPEDSGLKEARDSENNIIIIDSTLRSLLPPQLKKVITIQGHVWL